MMLRSIATYRQIGRRRCIRDWRARDELKWAHQLEHAAFHGRLDMHNRSIIDMIFPL